MRLTIYTAILTNSVAWLLFPVVAQAEQSALFYYRNGVRHELQIDQQRRVDLGIGRGVAPRVVPGAVSAKSLGDSTQLLIDVGSQTELALPGGVVVTMPPSTSTDQALAKLQVLGIANAKAVVGSQIWMVPSASGLPALQLANRLHESGQFLAAEPNWWRKRAGK